MNKSIFTRWFSVMAMGTAVLLAGCKGGKGGEQTEAEFKLNMEKGKKYMTTIVLDQDIESSAMGQTMNINQTMTFEYEVEVKEHKDNGNHVLSNTYKRMAMSQEVNGMGQSQKTVIDTKDPSKNEGMMAGMMQEAFGQMIDKSFDMEMDQNGKVLSTNLGELMKELGASDEGMDGSDMSAYSVQYPGKKVKIGESWEGEATRKSKGMNMIVKSTYTLKAIKDGIAEVEVKSTITSGEATTEGETIGKMSGTQTGTSYVDLKTGWTKEAKINQDMTMEINQGMVSMPMKIKGTITVTSK